MSFNYSRDAKLPTPNFNYGQFGQLDNLHVPQFTNNPIDERYFIAPDGTVFDLKTNKVILSKKQESPEGYWEPPKTINPFIENNLGQYNNEDGLLTISEEEYFNNLKQNNNVDSNKQKEILDEIEKSGLFKFSD